MRSAAQWKAFTAGCGSSGLWYGLRVDNRLAEHFVEQIAVIYAEVRPGRSVTGRVAARLPQSQQRSGDRDDQRRG